MSRGGPLIVQSDGSLLLEVDHPDFPAARDAVAPFAELEKSPEHIHTYRITPLSLWNAAAAGHDAEAVLGGLERFSKYGLPPNVVSEVRLQIGRYGRLRLVREGGGLRLISEDELLINEIAHHKKVTPFLLSRLDRRTLEVDPSNRGLVKQALIHVGFPVEDLAGYTAGDPLPLALRGTELRDYQQQAVEAFWAGGGPRGGSGVLVLPCGAGKTIIGLGVMSLAATHTLILAPNVSSVHQWIDELRARTDLPPDGIGEYTGGSKSILPVTVSTYQILTWRKKKADPFVHFSIFDRRNWGLIIYDEVHLLPAPVFRAVANLQARRRLGLTATLVREDHLEADVFSLIGPKKFDIPWKDLEQRGWIAQALCTEVRLDLPDDWRMEYAVADDRAKYRIAATNPRKIEAARRLVDRHAGRSVLIIGQYLDQLDEFNRHFDAPLITGATPQAQRDGLYARFRSGEIRLLIVSKVANFSIDLPDAQVAIEISGAFGSRQEEAQRLGRILRPKKDNTAWFYTLVTRDSRDQEFSANRQRFLTEQGYKYEIVIDGGRT